LAIPGKCEDKRQQLQGLSQLLYGCEYLFLSETCNQIVRQSTQGLPLDGTKKGKQSLFEACPSGVNVKVFSSDKLRGTHLTLNLSHSYL